MKIKMLLVLLAVIVITVPITANAALGDELAGRILLQVQQRGEAWFVHPTSFKRYYLGNPSLMLRSMQELGVGVSNEDLKNIPIGLIETGVTGTDTDGDGLSDDLEKAIETDLNKSDSDGDGFDDYTEVKNGYDPLGAGRMVGSGMNLNTFLIGNILLQVQQNGEAWYFNPLDEKRYFLGRPEQALEVVRKFGLGITDEDLVKIANGAIESVEPGVVDCGKAEFIAVEEGPEQDAAIAKALVATTCFYEQFKSCTKARVVTSLFGSEYYYEIVGSDGDKCLIKELYPTPGSLSKDFVDKSMICTYNQERGGRYFKELSEGVFSYKSSDLAYEKCEGELAEHLQK